MPNRHIDELRSDSDHVDKQKGSTGASTASVAKPSDLGTGMAAKTAQRLVDRKKQIDDASNY